MLIVVHSSFANAELRKLGRRAWTSFCFWVARETGLLPFASGVVGELEYDDDDDEGEASTALEDSRRWQRSMSTAEAALGAGIVIEDDMLGITTNGGEDEDAMLTLAGGRRLCVVLKDCDGRRSAMSLLLPTGYPEPGGKVES